MKIFSFPTFNLTKLLYTAEELGHEYELILLDAQKLEHKSPEHLKRHPLGKVPAVELNGTTFFESNSICRLMAELNDNRLYGNTPIDRANVNQWIDFITQHLMKHLATFAWEEGIQVHFFGSQANREACQSAQAALADLLPLVDQQLAHQTFLAGDSITIADTINFALFQIESFTSLDIDQHPHLLRWYQMMADRPAIDRALNQLPGRGIFSFLSQD